MTDETTVMTNVEIQKLLPHRYPFCWWTAWWRWSRVRAGWASRM